VQQAIEIAAGPVEELVTKLEIAPPRELAVGRGNAFAIGGYCYHPAAQVGVPLIELGGERQAVEHSGLPRLDGFARAGERGYHSGFLTKLTVAPRPLEEEIELSLVTTLAGGETRASLGSVRLLPELGAPPEPAPHFPQRAGPRVAVCMATYDPPPELLAAQLDSIRAQSHSNWICLISDDGSRPELLQALRAQTEADARFVVSPALGRRGFYANFQRALSMVPPEADFVALCDQDDRWHADKLKRLLERIEDDVELAYSDARVVDPGGALVHPSYWTARRNNYANLASLLIANTVTGAASLFRRRLLDDVLPFPPRLADPFHDHWLALVALARGRIAYVEQPLYDYVQHSEAVIGHATANRRPLPVRERLRDRLRNPGKGSQIVFFYNWTQQQLFAEVLRMRCGERMEASKRRALERFISVDRSLAGLGWLLGRRLRRLAGRTETMDIERFYAKALLRMRLVALQARGSRPPRWLRRDASIPPAPASEAAP
jgi:glycosyltransferase involved in cell wall biosynthesis